MELLDVNAGLRVELSSVSTTAPGAPVDLGIGVASAKRTGVAGDAKKIRIGHKELLLHSLFMSDALREALRDGFSAEDMVATGFHEDRSPSRFLDEAHNPQGSYLLGWGVRLLEAAAKLAPVRGSRLGLISMLL